MDDPISAERFSQLVGLIYDAAIDPGLWPEAMEAIRLELDFYNSTLNLQLMPSGKVLTNVTKNVPPEYAALIDRYGSEVLESWGGAEVLDTMPLDRPAVLTHLNPGFDFATTTNPYYINFARPQGIIDVLAVGLARDPRALGSLAFGRHESVGPIGERELAVVELLIPHLQRAATINRMLDTAEIGRATFAAALDGVDVPIILVGPSLEIFHANPVAQAMMRRGDMIHGANGTLSVRSPGAASALAVAVAQASREESQMGRRGLGIPLHRDGKSAGALHVLPLRPRRAGAGVGANAAVFVADIDSPFVAPTAIVTALFDLTPAESRVFGHLVQGLSVTQIAEALNVGQATIRTHLSRLFDKTDTRRQGDLIRIAASLSVPISF